MYVALPISHIALPISHKQKRQENKLTLIYLTTTNLKIVNNTALSTTTINKSFDNTILSTKQLIL